MVVRVFVFFYIPLLIFLVLFTFSAQAYGEGAKRKSAKPLMRPLQEGVCVFGRSINCCLGWTNRTGLCEPVCERPCVKGKCVGPNTCSCQEGYQGRQCSEDINECGLAKRPCSQRCMNTIGSFRCYCEPGYSLNTDQTTCTREPDCLALQCQYGCHSAEGLGPGCLCPPGLSLASDNRTCEDIDECAGSEQVCQVPQLCKNTFGGFVCVCRPGFKLGTKDNAIKCRDQNECLTSSHRCSRHARCLNTLGSYRCHCRADYTGDGYTCHRSKDNQSRARMYYRFKLSKRTRSGSQQV